MDSVLQLTPKQRGELFIAAAQQGGIDTVVLEKDFWVCWTLKNCNAPDETTVPH